MTEAYRKMIDDIAPSPVAVAADGASVFFPIEFTASRFVDCVNAHIEAGVARIDFPDAELAEKVLRPVAASIRGNVDYSKSKLKGQDQVQTCLSLCSSSRALQKTLITAAMLWSTTENRQAQYPTFFVEGFAQALKAAYLAWTDSSGLRDIAASAIARLQSQRDDRLFAAVHAMLSPRVRNFIAMLDDAQKVLTILARASSVKIASKLTAGTEELADLYDPDHMRWLTTSTRSRSSIATFMEGAGKKHESIRPSHQALTKIVAIVTEHFAVEPFAVAAGIATANSQIADAKRYLALSSAVHTLAVKIEKPRKCNGPLPCKHPDAFGSSSFSIPSTL